MGNTHKTARRSRARSLFGLDIGNGTLKVMQVEKATSKSSKSSRIIGYGTASFSKSAIDRGVIVDPEAIAHAVHHLFHTDLIGSITSHKVSMCIPAYRTFARTLTLPKTASKKLTATVSLEVEQYTLVPLEKLYVDYSLIARSKDYLEVLAMAVPRVVADSYQTLAKIMGLETALIETTSNAAVRLFAEDELSDMPAVIVDFGSLSTDINIYDKILLATSTAAGGGDVFTHAIRSKLGVTHAAY